MIREVLKSHIPVGLRRVARDLLDEISIQWHHRIALHKAKRHTQGGLQLNVGCGPDLKPEWINIDLTAHADLRFDMREPLPFATGSASMIYSEHFFEHLEYPDAVNFLKESRRVLCPGGIFSVGVPDTEWPLVAYVNNESEYFAIARERWHPAWCNTRMHNLNYHFRQDRQHKYAYDFETLAQMLREAGFSSVVRRRFDPKLDNARREHGTLYVDAR